MLDFSLLFRRLWSKHNFPDVALMIETCRNLYVKRNMMACYYNYNVQFPDVTLEDNHRWNRLRKKKLKASSLIISHAMNLRSLCKQIATIYGTSKLTGYILKPVNRFSHPIPLVDET
jgi:hypothetical protein